MDLDNPYEIDGQGSRCLRSTRSRGVEACLNYDTLKAALLLAYERVPEFHRKRFRTLNKFGNETYSTFEFRLALPFNSWMDGEEASTDINRLKEVMKLEQFTNCLPTEIHRWVVEKRPKVLVDAAKLADEYAVLYKPFHAEQDNSWKSDHMNYADKPEKTFHKNGGRGTFRQKNHHKGNSNHKTAVLVTKNWAPEVLCIRCGRGGHTASVCYAKKPFVHPQTQLQNSAFDTAPKTIALVTKHQILQLCRENQGLVHTNLASFCVNATLCTNKGTRRPVVLLRDSGALLRSFQRNVSTR